MHSVSAVRSHEFRRRRSTASMWYLGDELRRRVQGRDRGVRPASTPLLGHQEPLRRNLSTARTPLPRRVQMNGGAGAAAKDNDAALLEGGRIARRRLGSATSCT